VHGAAAAAAVGVTNNGPQAPQSVAAALGRARPQQVGGGAQDVEVGVDGSNSVRAQFKRGVSSGSDGPRVKV